MSLKTEYTISRIVDAYNVLKTEQDLSPRNEKITQVLTALVGSLSDQYSAKEERAILTDPRVQSVRTPMLDKLAQAEGDMEKYWAEYFLSKDELTVEDLKEFWYWQNYDDLVNGELPHMQSFNKAAGNRASNDNDHIVFVGAGPLPLTAIIRHLKTGVRMTCVDNDPVACAQSRKLLQMTGLDQHIDVVEGNGAEIDYSSYSHVIVAALVPNKSETVGRVRETAEKRVKIGIRSAERLHTLLYDPLDEAMDILKDCSFASRTAHDPKVINTTVFYDAEPLEAQAPKSNCANCQKCKHALIF
jgi:hypothetical protein